MGYSIYQDMQEVWNNPEEWINHGRDILLASCKHKKGVEGEGWCEKCDIGEEAATPMMNYIYPLELSDFEESKILKVVKETNCTILEKESTGQWFIALCGGGMDLSQDIGYSFVILETWLPSDLLREVCKQPLFSLGRKQYRILAKSVIKQCKMESDKNKIKAKEWGESLKALSDQERERKQEQKI